MATVEFTQEEQQVLYDDLLSQAYKMETMYAREATHQEAVRLRNRATLLRELAGRIYHAR